MSFFVHTVFNPVNGLTAGNQFVNQSAHFNDGSFITLFADNSDSSFTSFRLKARITTTNGHHLYSDILVSDFLTEDGITKSSADASVVRINDDSVFVTWTQFDGGINSTSSSILGRVVHSNGTMEEIITIDDSNFGEYNFNSTESTISYGQSNKLLSAFIDNKDYGSNQSPDLNNQIYFKISSHIENNSVFFANNIGILDLINVKITSLHSSPLVNGNFVLSYSLQNTILTNITSVNFQLLNHDASLGFNVNVKASDNLNELQLHDVKSESLRGDKFIVTWIEAALETPDLNDFSIKGQRFDQNGLSVGQELGLVPNVIGASSAYSIASLSDGRFAIGFWTKGVIAVQVFGENFERSGQFMPVGYTSGPSNVTLSALEDGRFSVAWTQTETIDVRAAIVDPKLYDGDYIDFAFPPDLVDVPDTGIPLYPDIVYGGDRGDSFSGGVGNDQLFGRDGNDFLSGGVGEDIIDGGNGDDTLNGGSSVDTIRGGRGNDIYYVDSNADIVVELTNEGDDTVYSENSIVLKVNFENLILTGGKIVNGTGNTGNNVIRGNFAGNILNGLSGSDSMSGGDGNDSYIVDNVGDVASENPSNGIDTVFSSVSFTIGSNIERLNLIGASAINGTGNALDNFITGNAAANTLMGGLGNDTLNGGAGTDAMIGGTGNDKFFVDTPLDVVTELLGQGTDEVCSSVTYTLGANLENLTLTGALSINGTGNALNNVIVGNSALNILNGGDGNDTLNGGVGADTMIGGLGNDVFVVDNAGDVVNEAAGVGTGIDRVETAFSYTLGANVENLTLTGTLSVNGTGNVLANVLRGNLGHNVLDGLGGADNMAGGLGNDTYVVDQLGEVVTEAFGEGVDTVRSAVNYTLGANVENLVLLGALNLAGAGNALDNRITGNSGNNTLNGLAGADTMSGLLGDDIYFVDNALDIVSEAGGGGTDTVNSSVDFVLGVGLENLTLTGAALVGIGNTSNNIIVGTAGANTLNGGAGVDTMSGGAGDDTYFVDNTSDVVSDTTGVDKVFSTATYTLSANVENLELTGAAAINGTGNTLANAIIGNGAANQLNGLAGADTLTGGLGADRFVFTTALNVMDTITDFQVGIDDIVVSAAAFGGLVAGGVVSLVSGAVPAPSGAGPQFLYDTDDGRLSFDRDGTGAVFAPVLFAQLTGAPVIGAGDFVVIA